MTARMEQLVWLGFNGAGQMKGSDTAGAQTVPTGDDDTLPVNAVVLNRDMELSGQVSPFVCPFVCP